MERSSVRFGIVGPGAIAHFHAGAIGKTAGAELVSVLGRNPAKTKAFASEYKIDPYTDPQAFLNAENIDALAIASPSGAHLEIAERAAALGIHVLCEKPLEVTSKRSAQIINACKSGNVSLGVIFQGRFERCAALTKEAIDGGRLGKLLFASCQMRWARSQAYYDSAPWRGTWALDGGGCLMNQGIHSIDLLLHLAGDVSHVSAFKGPRTHKRIEVEDNLCAMIRFASGAIGTVLASTSCEPGFPRKFEISGEKGTICIEDNRIVRWEFAEPLPTDEGVVSSFELVAGGGGAANPMDIDISGHCRVVEDFVASLKEKREPGVSGKEGKKSVDFISAVYKSMEKNGEVTAVEVDN